MYKLLNILTIIFIVLKLTDNVDWSWWTVFSPQWVPFLIAGSIGIIYYLLGGFFKWK